MTNNQLLKKLSQDMRMRNFSHYTYDTYMSKTKEMIKYFNKPLEEQTKNDGKLTEQNLKDILNKYFKDVPETLPEDYALLAEKNIGVDLENSPDTYLKQNDSAGTVAFCSSDTYSSLGNDLTSVESLNDNATIIADTTSALYYARKYAESITGNAEDGRLMTVDEVVAL